MILMNEVIKLGGEAQDKIEHAAIIRSQDVLQREILAQEILDAHLFVLHGPSLLIQDPEVLDQEAPGQGDLEREIVRF